MIFDNLPGPHELGSYPLVPSVEIHLRGAEITHCTGIKQHVDGCQAGILMKVYSKTI